MERRVRASTLVTAAATAALVLVTHIWVLEARPVAAQTAPPGACTNSEDTRVEPVYSSASGSYQRCVAERYRSTRGNGLKAACFGPKALGPAEYTATECRNGWATQVEAIAQARYIARLNAATVYGDTAAVGVTPNLQWEVHSPRGTRPGRIDALIYDRNDPMGRVGLVELKQKISGSSAQTASDQLQDYVVGFASNREVGRYDVSGYYDGFRVITKDCPNVLDGLDPGDAVPIKIVYSYTVHPSSEPTHGGVLLVSKGLPEVSECLPNGTEQPQDDDEDDDDPPTQEPVPVEVPTLVPEPAPLPVPTVDLDGNGVEDLWEEIIGSNPDWAELPPPEVVPGTGGDPAPITGNIWGDAAVVAAAFFLAGLICIAVCPALLPAAAGAEAVSVMPALSHAIFGIVVAGLIPGLSDVLGDIAGELADLAGSLFDLIGLNLWGDPHFGTLDGLSYDMHAVGELHLLEIPSKDVDVQARLEPAGSSVSGLARTATEINGIAVEIEDDQLFIDGELSDIGSPYGFVDLGDGAGVLRVGDRWVVKWPDIGKPVVMVQQGRGVGFHVPDGTYGVRGLLGNGNGDPLDDLATRSGTPLASTTSSHELNDAYADSWRVTDDDTLFTYGAGQSTATFTDLGFPHAPSPSLGPGMSGMIAASQVCETAGVDPGPQFDACVLDVAVTDDPTYAGEAALVTDVLIDPQAHAFDGDGVLSEDFEGTIGPNFAASAYSEDVSTTRVAGPVFDTPGYQAYARGIGRHSQVDVGLDLLAYGDIDADARDQTVELRSGSTVIGSVRLDGAQPQATGMITSAQVTDLGLTAGGTPFRRVRVEATVPHATPAFDLALLPSGFRSAWATSLGVDDVRFELTVPEVDDFATSLPVAVPSDPLTPAAGAGSLEVGGAEDTYEVEVDEGTVLVFSPADCVVGATFTLVRQGGGARVGLPVETCRRTVTEPLPAGIYRLVVTGPTAGTYGFTLRAADDPQVFDYTLDTVVATDVPAEGAGLVEDVGAIDRYRFTVPAGGLTLQYDRLGGNHPFTLVDRVSGEVVTTGVSDAQLFLPAGDYELSFDRPGAYSFRVFEVPLPQTFDIALGDSVSNGSPAAGAGNLETIASEDRYRFTVPAGGVVAQYQRNDGNRVFTLIDRDNGNILVTGRDHRQYILPEGDYEMVFRGAQGPYAFALFEVPDPQVFPYAIGDLVADGVPAPGAGRIETVASIDRYHFTVPEGGMDLQFDRLAGTKSWWLTDRTTGELVRTGSANVQFRLPQGDYQLEFKGKLDGYSFRLFKVPDVETFDYVIGDVVSDGVPRPGAGFLETTASVDRYWFTVPSGGRYLQFDRTEGTKSWTLTDRTSGAVVRTGMDDVRYTLPAGDYQLEFRNKTDGYSFRLFEVPDPQVFAYVIGTTVSDGVPAPGAGRLENIASIDRYHFDVPVGGLDLQFDRLEGTKSWTLRDRTTGTVVRTGGNDVRFTLPEGSYELEFKDNKDQYAFKLFVVPPPQVFTYTLGTVVSPNVPQTGAGLLETIASVDRYQFTVPAGGSNLLYDRRSGTKSFTIYNRATGAAVGAGGNDVTFWLPGGDYELEVKNSIDGYSFSLSIV